MNILLTPLNYLRIETEGKRKFDLVIPLVCTCFVLLVFGLVPGKIQLLGPGGFVLYVAQLLQVLTGFFIAALAAVATFNRESIDQPLAGSDAILVVRVRGVVGPKKLTRRQFVCYLFGYLAYVCLFLYGLSVVALLLQTNVKTILADRDLILGWLKVVFSFFYIFVLMNLLTTTLVGLHYLADRLHRD